MSALAREKKNWVSGCPTRRRCVWGSSVRDSHIATEGFLDYVAAVPQERDENKNGRHSARNDRWLPLSAKTRDAGFCKCSLLTLNRRSLGLLIQNLLQPVEHLHRREALLHTRIRLALLLNRRKELAVLQLDPVHRHGHFRKINLVLVAIDEIVVISLIGPVIADVAEERANRPL